MSDRGLSKEVMEFRHKHHRRDSVKASETNQAADEIPIRLKLRDLCHPRIESANAFIELVDRPQHGSAFVGTTTG